MELYQIRQFLAVAETRSFTKAAAHIGVSQPALSAGILKLETELGAKLLIRDRRAVKLTSQGERLVDRARQIIQACSAVRSDMRANDLRETIKVGVLTSLPIRKVTAIANACLAAFPHVSLQFREEQNPELAEMLVKDRLDLAILSSTACGDSPQQAFLFDEAYMLVCPADHPFAPRESVTLSDIHGEDFILRTTCEARRATQDELSARGISSKIVASTSQDDRALSLVAAGIGVALMPALFSCPGVIQIPLSDFEISRKIVLRKRKSLSAQGEEIFRFISKLSLEYL